MRERRGAESSIGATRVLNARPYQVAHDSALRRRIDARRIAARRIAARRIIPWVATGSISQRGQFLQPRLIVASRAGESHLLRRSEPKSPHHPALTLSMACKFTPPHNRTCRVVPRRLCCRTTLRRFSLQPTAGNAAHERARLWRMCCGEAARDV